MQHYSVYNQFSTNKFHNFIPDLDINSFLIKPVDKTEIQNITLPLSSLKTVGANSIPIEILKLLSNNILNQLSDLFNLSF